MKSGKPKPGKQMEQSARGLSLLRMTAAPYFQKPGEKLKNIPEGTEKSLIYAYIEKENFQSLQFAIQNDFLTVRKFREFRLVSLTWIHFSGSIQTRKIMKQIFEGQIYFGGNREKSQH